MFKYVSAIILTAAVITPVSAQNSIKYIRCTGQAVGTSDETDKIDVHYKIENDRLYRFSESLNAFQNPCAREGTRCSYENSDISIKHKQYDLFGMNGKGDYFETTIIIGRSSGTYSESARMLEPNGRQGESLGMYFGSCVEEESPVK